MKEFILNPVLIWFVVGLIMFLIELAGPGLFVVFFGVGAWIIAIICYFVDISINAQLFSFIVISVLSLVLFRNMLKSLIEGHTRNKQNLESDLDDYVGSKGVVKEEIDASKGGKIELNGTQWDAEADEVIAVGETVEIIEKDNLTFKVKKL